MSVAGQRGGPAGNHPALRGEILRLWVASSDYRDDVRSRADLKGRPRATGRSATRSVTLSNLFDFEPEWDFVAEESPCRWTGGRGATAELNAKVPAPTRPMNSTWCFTMWWTCATDLGAVLRHPQGQALHPRPRRQAARRRPSTELPATCPGLVSVTSFTAEEAWQLMPGKQGRVGLLAGMPHGAHPR